MSLKVKIYKLQKGQSLFELVVAIAISALIVVAMVSLATNSIKNSNFSRNKALASSYAQEATEWLRGQRDSDFTNFLSKAQTSPNWCLPTLGFNQFVGDPYSQCVNKIDGTVFRRWVTFSITVQNGKNVIESDVVVLWTDSGGVHEVKSATNLSNWR